MFEELATFHIEVFQEGVSCQFCIDVFQGGGTSQQFYIEAFQVGVSQVLHGKNDISFTLTFFKGEYHISFTLKFLKGASHQFYVEVFQGAVSYQ